MKLGPRSYVRKLKMNRQQTVQCTGLLLREIHDEPYRRIQVRHLAFPLWGGNQALRTGAKD